MRFILLTGKTKSVDLNPYKIDWDAKSLSNVQFTVKQFLKPFWKTDPVYEECPVAGTKLRLDFLNWRTKVAVEVNGRQHKEFNEFMHNGSRSVFLIQKKRDEKKAKWCQLNGITLISIDESQVKSLTPDWFKERGVTLA